MFYFSGVKIRKMYVNPFCKQLTDSSVGLALNLLCSCFHKDKVRHDRYGCFDLLQIEVTLVNVSESIFPRGKEYGRAYRKN